MNECARERAEGEGIALKENGFQTASDLPECQTCKIIHKLLGERSSGGKRAMAVDPASGRRKGEAPAVPLGRLASC